MKHARIILIFFITDDTAILDCVLKLDISFFEQLYTTEEKNFIQMQEKQMLIFASFWIFFVVRLLYSLLCPSVTQSFAQK